jgi:hypothetical protein
MDWAPLKKLVDIFTLYDGIRSGSFGMANSFHAQKIKARLAMPFNRL